MFINWLIILGVGRYRNESYGEFLKTLNSAKRLNTRIGPREVCYTTQLLYMYVIAERSSLLSLAKKLIYLVQMVEINCYMDNTCIFLHVYSCSCWYIICNFLSNEWQKLLQALTVT